MKRAFLHAGFVFASCIATGAAAYAMRDGAQDAFFSTSTLAFIFGSLALFAHSTDS
jgi:hypothetical protein